MRQVLFTFAIAATISVVACSTDDRTPAITRVAELPKVTSSGYAEGKEAPFALFVAWKYYEQETRRWREVAVGGIKPDGYAGGFTIIAPGTNTPKDEAGAQLWGTDQAGVQLWGPDVKIVGPSTRPIAPVEAGSLVLVESARDRPVVLDRTLTPSMLRDEKKLRKYVARFVSGLETSSTQQDAGGKRD